MKIIQIPFLGKVAIVKTVEIVERLKNSSGFSHLDVGPHFSCITIPFIGLVVRGKMYPEAPLLDEDIPQLSETLRLFSRNT